MKHACMAQMDQQSRCLAGHQLADRLGALADHGWGWSCGGKVSLTGLMGLRKLLI